MTKNKILSCSRRTIAFILVFLVTVTSSSFAAPAAWAKKKGKTYSCYSITFEADLYGSNAITGIAEAMDWNLQSDILDEWTGLDGKTHYRESGDEYEYYLEFSGTSDGYTPNDQNGGYKGTFEYLLDDPPPRYEDNNLDKEMTGTGINFPSKNGGKMFDWLKNNEANWNFVNDTNGTGESFTDGWWYDPGGEPGGDGGYDYGSWNGGSIQYGEYADGGVLMPAANANVKPEDVVAFVRQNYPNWTDAMIVALLCNIAIESRFCSFAENPDDKGARSIGLYQCRGGRGLNMVNWCESNGYDPNSMEGQLRYMMTEMDGENMDWGWTEPYSGGNWEIFQSFPDTMQGFIDATRHFRGCFERGEGDAAGSVSYYAQFV